MGGGDPSSNYGFDITAAAACAARFLLLLLSLLVIEFLFLHLCLSFLLAASLPRLVLTCVS